MRRLPHRCPACSRSALVLFTSVECCNEQCVHYVPAEKPKAPELAWEEEKPTNPVNVWSSTTTPMCCGTFMNPFYVTGQQWQWHCWKCGRCQ